MREGEPRADKVAVVDEVKSRLSSSSAALLTEYRGLKVAELADLRRALRTAGGDYKIYKNTLVRFAVRDLGIDIDEATLTGPTAIAFVEGDAAAVAKALRDYSRTNANLVLKGGVLSGKALSADETRALAELPTREVLLAQLAGALQAPMAKMAGLLQALPRNMAYGLKALLDQKVAGGEALPADAPAEADISDNEAAADAVADDAPGMPEEQAHAAVADEAPADEPVDEVAVTPEAEAHAAAEEDATVAAPAAVSDAEAPASADENQDAEAPAAADEPDTSGHATSETTAEPEAPAGSSESESE
jgi:large subunit ribosomal protein L10